MSQASTALSARWPLAPASATDWLRELAGDGLTGFMPPPLPDAAWVLNAMYEHDQAPTGISHDDVHRAAIANGSVSPEIVGGIDMNTVGTVTGGGLGRAEHPGPGWKRLRWADLARRSGDPMIPDRLLPCYRCFPSVSINGSWPITIVPPTEGSMDRETWNRLIGLLRVHSPAGADTRCLAYYSPLTLGATDFENLHVRAGLLGDAEILYDNPEVGFSPSNLWAEDRSWIICTDYDLWATKVAGPASLIEVLLKDPEIEAVRLPWAP
ncbi:hypothetical protein HS041_28345 [Planomonospora sp. ID67723]|uniref:hypothetical protein n=1 Tax=Planomonospora sp. ID67723 TaxID=2738134 RepID=UPI0018C36A5B|nr:hypothetical protein [Planomonospora sp. ID67723]MBG0831645.1 hypothetical protein [Planomonospora sp. ID67723]